MVHEELLMKYLQINKNKSQTAHAWLCKIERLSVTMNFQEMIANVNEIVKYCFKYGFFEIKIMAELKVVEMCLCQ